MRRPYCQETLTLWGVALQNKLHKVELSAKNAAQLTVDLAELMIMEEAASSVVYPRRDPTCPSMLHAFNSNHRVVRIAAD